MKIVIAKYPIQEMTGLSKKIGLKLSRLLDVPPRRGRLGDLLDDQVSPVINLMPPIYTLTRRYPICAFKKSDSFGT